LHLHVHVRAELSNSADISDAAMPYHAMPCLAMPQRCKKLLCVSHADNNNISGSLPDVLLASARLQKLWLHNNWLTGSHTENDICSTGFHDENGLCSTQV
jgi:hypothetical protein